MVKVVIVAMVMVRVMVMVFVMLMDADSYGYGDGDGDGDGCGYTYVYGHSWGVSQDPGSACQGPPTAGRQSRPTISTEPECLKSLRPGPGLEA